MMKKNHSEEFQQLWSDSKYNRGPLVSLIVLRVALCIGIVMFVISSLVNVAAGLLLVIATAVILFFIYSKRLKKILPYNWNAVSCVTSRPAKRNKNASLPIKQRFVKHLLDRDLHLADFEVSQSSPSVGKTLKELNFRQTCGVSVVTIIRGRRTINIPGGEERLYPFDHIIVAATDKRN